MKLWGALAAMGFLLLAMVQFNTPDLRGWPPAKGPDDLAGMQSVGAVLEPTLPGGRGFKLGDCLPRSIRYDTPTAEEYSGTATMAVVTCRSRAGATRNVAAYVALVGGAFLLIRGFRRRRTKAA